MVQVIDTGNPQGKLSEMLGMSLGQGIGNGLNTFFANRSLESVMHDKALEGAPTSKKLQALQSALSPYGERGQEIFQQRMAIEQQEMQERQQKALADYYNPKTSPEKKSQLREVFSPEQQFKIQERDRSISLGKNIGQAMRDRGVPEEVASYYEDLISNTEKGTGQSAVINDALQASNRYGNQPEGNAFLESKPSGKFSKTNPEFEFPIPTPITAKNPNERSDIEEKNAQENLKLFNEEHRRKRDYQEFRSDFKKLENLNPHISTGFGKWNINQLDGKIILPAQATPEERQFVKIINRQLDKAQGTYGGKVTNFEAGQFMQRFPDLGDNPESRDALIKDLQVLNDINLLYANALDETSRVYNPRQISPDQIIRISEDMVEDQVNAMREQYEQQFPANQNQLQNNEVEVTWNGQRYAVPQNELQAWLNAGAKQ